MKAAMLRLADLGRKPWAVPLGLLGLIVLAYGPFVPRLGFYWDDWPTAWFNYLRGPLVYWKVYADVRPVLPWTYMLTTPWLGFHPVAWQAFGLAARWLAVLGAWVLFRAVWPTRRMQAGILAAILALYPGFKQGTIPIIYSHFFLLMGLMCVSLAATVWSVRRPESRLRWTVLAIVAGALSMFSVEYFAGLEVLRPLLIWMTLGEGGEHGQRRMGRTAAMWSPYAGLFALYLAWRVWVLAFPSYQPQLLSGMEADAGLALGLLLQSIGSALWTATAAAWGQMFDFPVLAEVGRRYMLGYVAMLGAIGAWALCYLAAQREPVSADGSHPWWARPLEAVGLGLAAMLGGGLPIWVTQLPVWVDYPWDRMTLALMLGAVLVVCGLIELALRPAALRIAFVAGMLALSAGVHYRSNMSYVRAGERMGQFLWQLSWRVPDIERGTTVVTNDIPLDYYSDNSLTAALNWMYSPENRSLRMDYMLYYPTVRVGLALSEPLPGLAIEQVYRAAEFTGSTSQMLALQFAPPGCVHVLDVIYDDSMPNLPASLSAWVPLSRLDLIRMDAAEPASPPLYPDEPRHDWCYYFEKADLARQRGDWTAVADLGDEGFAVDHPNDPSERLVFIEGYAHVGKWDRAEAQSYAALEQNPAVNRMVCHTWDRILAEAGGGEEAAAAGDRVRAQALCEAG